MRAFLLFSIFFATQFNLLGTELPRYKDLIATDLIADLANEPEPMDGTLRSMPSTIRHHKSLLSNYTGTVIELLVSPEALNLTDLLFQQFGGIHYKILANGQVSYCILANFSSKKSLSIFVENMIQPKIASARAIEYKQGKQKWCNRKAEKQI